MTRTTSTHVPSERQVSSSSVRLSEPVADSSPVQNGVGLKAKAAALYTHNPYWYEGFSLSNFARPQHGAPSFTENRRHRDADSAVQSFPILAANGQYPPLQPRAAAAMHRVRTTPPAVQQEVWYQPSSEPPNQRPVSMRTKVPPQSIPDTTDHRSHMGLSDSDDETDKKTHLQNELVQCIVKYFDGYGGSLPSERVQNIIKKDYAELYDAVVVGRFKKKWHKFVQHFPDTFHLFSRPARPGPEEEHSWRIRLTWSEDWEETDRQEEELRSGREREMVEKTQALLLQYPDYQAPVHDLVNQLNIQLGLETLGTEVAETGSSFDSQKGRKIRGGDLKRLSRKFNGFLVLEGTEGDQRRVAFVKLMRLCSFESASAV